MITSQQHPFVSVVETQEGLGSWGWVRLSSVVCDGVTGWGAICLKRFVIRNGRVFDNEKGLFVMTIMAAIIIRVVDLWSL